MSRTSAHLVKKNMETRADLRSHRLHAQTLGWKWYDMIYMIYDFTISPKKFSLCFAWLDVLWGNV